MTKAEEMRAIKSEANAPKSELIALLSQMEQVSAAEARKLGKIIEKLERWQNS
jgi:hypothetical protein